MKANLLYILITSILLFLNSLLTAQVPDTLWTTTLGGSGWDAGNFVQQTLDDGYIITGRTESFGVPGSDVWLIKTNSSGDTIWTRTFNGEWGNSVQQTLDGGYIIAGYTGAFGNVLLIKTDSLGNSSWTKHIYLGGWGNSVQQTSDSGYIVSGSVGAFGEDIFLVKTDMLGDTLWTKTYGDSGRDFGGNVQQTSDGGYIIIGQTNSIGAGEWDLWLIKTDEFGDTVWTNTFGGSGSEQGGNIQQTLDGGYIITGSTNSFGAGGYDVWLIKTDALGDTLWTNTFGGSYSEKGNSVRQTSDGGYIITGETYPESSGYRDVLIIKTNMTGELLWSKTIGGVYDDIGHSVQQTNDNGYIITGQHQPNNSIVSDFWLIKIGPDMTSIEDKSTSIILEYSLVQNYPNPFNPATTIKYSLPYSEKVKIEIFNLLGQRIQTLLNKFMPAGPHEVEFSPNNLTSGVYLYRIEAGEFHQVKKMILMK